MAKSAESQKADPYSLESASAEISSESSATMKCQALHMDYQYTLLKSENLTILFLNYTVRAAAFSISSPNSSRVKVDVPNLRTTIFAAILAKYAELR